MASDSNNQRQNEDKENEQVQEGQEDQENMENEEYSDTEDEDSMDEEEQAELRAQNQAVMEEIREMKEDIAQMQRANNQHRRMGGDLSKIMVPLWREMQLPVAVGGEVAVGGGGGGPQQGGQGNEEVQQPGGSQESAAAMQESDTAREFAWAKSTDFYHQELRRLRRKFRGVCPEEEMEIFAYVNTLQHFGRGPKFDEPPPPPSGASGMRF